MGLVYYLPTFSRFFMVNVGKYTIHGRHGLLKNAIFFGKENIKQTGQPGRPSTGMLL